MSDVKHPLVVKLKSGEYDGTDIMDAWLLIERLQTQLENETESHKMTLNREDLLQSRNELLEAVVDAARWFSVHMPETHVYGLIEKGNYRLLKEALAAAVEGK